MPPSDSPYDKSQLVGILGIAYDAKSSFMRGPAQAPPRIREALTDGSSNYWAENGNYTGPRDDLTDLGDLEPETYDEIYPDVSRQLGAVGRLLILGGDHSITYPAVKACREKFGAFDILQIDAHSDLYDVFEGDRFSHACPFARIMEEGLASRLVQVGIRTLPPQLESQVKRFGVELIELKNLSQFSSIEFQSPLYISLDLDVLDPAFAPGISHYEPGGMSTRELLEIIGSIQAPLVGADIVEFNPRRDVNGVTAALCAKLTKELLAKMLPMYAP
jgi:arginase